MKVRRKNTRLKYTVDTWFWGLSRKDRKELSSTLELLLNISYHQLYRIRRMPFHSSHSASATQIKKLADWKGVSVDDMYTSIETVEAA